MSNRLIALRDWVDARFPLMRLWNEHLAQYYAPKNFNFWYFFGSLALFVLVIQIITGIWLTMNYKPSAELAFASVEYIMRDVEWGWWIRYMHSTGASAFFIVIYLHMYRAMLYGSYKRPRELLWNHRHAHLLHTDGRGVLRLFAAVGSDVLLGRPGNHLVVSARCRLSETNLPCGYGAISSCRT